MTSRAAAREPLGHGWKAAVFLVALVLAGCAQRGGSSASPGPGWTPGATAGGMPGATAGLAGREFLSTDIHDGGKPVVFVAGTRIRLTFRDVDLSASAGCNIIGGQYRIEDGRLVFSGGSMTEMACPDGRDAQDSWLVGILGARPQVTLAGDELTLESGTITIRLLDREVAEPDQPLAGTGWFVVGLIDGDVASSIPAGVVPRVTFNADGTVDVATGCNDGSGRWTQHDGTIEITALAFTKKACMPPLAQVEDAVTGVLRGGSIEVQIDAGSMTLSVDGHGLQLQAPLPD